MKGSKLANAISVLLGLLLAVSIVMVLRNGGPYVNSRLLPSLERVMEQDTPRDRTDEQTLLRQRNNFSRELNLKQQQLGQLQCQMKGVAKSDTGGWCKQASSSNSTHHKTDFRLAEELTQLFKGKRVASFGDGPGIYKQLLLASGSVKGYDAYDGAPFSEETSEGRVTYLDLTLPQYGLPMYDWILSLEVAEHIPEAFEAVFIDNIVRHAREGVVLSWAVPGQGGYSHVNNKSFEYVKNLMAALGFEHDPQASKRLKSKSTLPWLQKNTNVYRRIFFSEIQKMGALQT